MKEKGGKIRERNIAKRMKIKTRKKEDDEKIREGGKQVRRKKKRKV